MTPPPGTFVVADLNARGELQMKESYRYEHLERIPGAADLIGHWSGSLWRAPEEFEAALPVPSSRLSLRWHASSSTAGIATLRCEGTLTSLTLLVCGLSQDQDALTLQAFQRHLLRELRDTPYEPAFALMELSERPLAATFNFQPPADAGDQRVAALADRCFAASYFRFHGLA